MKVGDVYIYRGKAQRGVLAPGDLVEIHEVFHAADSASVKLSGSYANHFFICQHEELEAFSLPKQFPAYVSRYPNDDQRAERKLKGECESCGKLLPVSMHGLSPCPSCNPSQPVKW